MILKFQEFKKILLESIDLIQRPASFLPKAPLKLVIQLLLIDPTSILTKSTTETQYKQYYEKLLNTNEDELNPVLLNWLKGGEYKNWLYREYYKMDFAEQNRFLTEDWSNWRLDLLTYHTLKSKNKLIPTERQIDLIDGISGLRDILEKYADVKSKTEEIKEIKVESTIVVAETESYKILIPLTYVVSSLYG